MFKKITKIDILALIAGLISGPVAYFSVESGILSFLNMGVLIFPGLIFGLFSIPFIKHYVDSYSKILLWVILSTISYFAAYWIGFFSTIIHVGDLIKEIIAYTVGGFVGSLILIFGYYLITKYKSYKYFIKILVVGALLPCVLLLFFGIEFRGLIGPSPKEPYTLVMMTLWQGFMLFTFVHLFRKASEEKNELQKQTVIQN